MKRLTKKRVEYLKNLTNLCYKVAFSIVCCEASTPTCSSERIMEDFKSLNEIYVFLINKDRSDLAWFTNIRNKVGDKYLQIINTLSDEDLQDILNCHNKGKFLRADKTINSIVSEISRRSIGDSSESKLIYILKKATP